MPFDKVFLPSIKYQSAESRRNPDINLKIVKSYILIAGIDNKVDLNLTISKISKCFV